MSYLLAYHKLHSLGNCSCIHERPVKVFQSSLVQVSARTCTENVMTVPSRVLGGYTEQLMVCTWSQGIQSTKDHLAADGGERFLAENKILH